MGDGTKQVRVDNWGIFFLQRLQMFFSKTDYCDMTLQFEGNVQLKVHRLVMNACTEYFQFLEQTCTLEDNIIMMPSDLQADVIVPIVNFMYTGMLEFHLSIFDKLYKTAQIMNITILTKLLDAQKRSVSPAVRSLKKKLTDSPQVYTPVKKTILKQPSHHSDLPPPLPGRKIPVWKRKSIPTTVSPLSHSSFPPEPKWTSSTVDPLSVPDNTPKPTRFEWPDDDLPTLSLMDTSFEEISYTSKPLLTQEEEQRATTSFDDLKHIPNNRSVISSKKRTSPNIDMEEVKNYGKELKIRSGLSHEDEIIDDVSDSGLKRKATEQKTKNVVKKVRFEEQQDSKTTTISIATDGKSSSSLDHERLVAEILKKYPQLVKKNKNIRLKIMAKGGKNVNEPVAKPTPKLKTIEIQQKTPDSPKTPTQKSNEINNSEKNKAPWICSRCSTEEDPCEFVLYYLYRKHMTDVHNEKFDPKLCKYCGHKCSKQNLLMYHLYTKHGMKPPPSYNFPKCDQCPFIALSANILNKHKLRHGKNEIQCVECKLTFTSPTTLTSHIQITGHTGKTNKNNYDCQYCTKRYQSGVNLFSHVRLQHKNEAVRDGIVSIDEMDDMEDYDEEESSRDEYILPEIISDPEPSTKKVNIISDVKVVQDQQTRQQPLTLEPSSEAEALNNVASGIATSLGLVDIVVLNDNQQLFIQPNQESYSNDQNEQPEFILPELTGRETFVQTQNEVITTDGVITQSMLSSNDIASTDELVMVLTDHDYGDNQEEISNENSNIVVLYSHPVDGQQDQFITSQGNLMVNSQGLLEIRNGATITSTASQVVMTPQDTHIESIEMIQREIESHTDLKQETLYEEEKPVIEENQLKESEVEEATPSSSNNNSNNKNESLIESLTQGEQLELTSPLVPLEESTNTQKETETEERIEPETEKEETVPEKEKSPEPPPPKSVTQEEKEPELEATPLEQEEKEEVSAVDSFQEEEPIKEVPQQDLEKPSVESDDKEKEDSVEVAATLPTEDTEKEPELTDDSSKTDVMEIDEEKTTSKEEISPEQSDTSTSQFNDENSQSSQENQQETVATKMSILDDWEDTDSQQSGDKEKSKDADETVHKLMDDWEEEDEEDKKETDKQ